MPRLGIISDTHNFLDPQVNSLFAGVDHILHAGDIGGYHIILELQTIAPVTAVSGNTDAGLCCRDTEVVALFGRTLLLQHIVDPHRPSDALRHLLAGARPNVVVFGHTHRPFCERIDGVLFLNPGSAGKRRFDTPRSLAVLQFSGTDLDVDFHDLER